MFGVMNTSIIFIESLYEFKRSRRSILFRIFALLAILGLIIYQFAFLSRGSGISINELFRFYLDWPSQALASSIPFKSAYYFNFIQLLLVVCFAVNDSREFRLSTRDALYTRPQGNHEIVVGRFLGRLLIVTLLNVLAFAVSIIFNVVLFPLSFEVGYYFFYWLTLTFPSLIYFLGFSCLLTRFVRNQGLGIMILLVFIGGMISWGADLWNGAFDPSARHVPNMFSDFTGHVNLGSYLLQRVGTLVTGVGFLVLSVVPFWRIPNSLHVTGRCTSVAVGLFVVAGGLLGGYWGQREMGRSDRKRYKVIYDKYAGEARAKVCKNDLHVRELENGGISVKSRMEIENVNKMRVPLIVYLNPGLEVKSFEVDGRAVSCRRECQVLLPGKELEPGERCSVEIEYEGQIDNSVCFLDVPAARYGTPEVNRNGIYHYGYKPAFCERGYKLLTPECIWYPVCLPPYSQSGCRGVNFTRYALRVEHDSRLVAVSQGEVTREKEGVTTFVVSHDMPGISLCIGEYKKREMTIFTQIPDDTTRVEVYYLPGHEYLLDKYDLPEEKMFEILAGNKHDHEYREGMYRMVTDLTVEEWESIRSEDNWMQNMTELINIQYAKRGFDPRRHYPYRSLTLLEVPCDFHCFSSLTRLSGEREQGGMVFVPEKLYSMKGYQFSVSESENRDEDIENELNKDIENLLWQGSCDITPVLYGKTTFIASDDCPVLHSVLVDMARASDGLTYTLDDVQLVEYLNGHSLKDALHDSALSSDELRNIIRMKSDELYMYMLLHIDKGAFPKFYFDSIAGNLFKEMSLEEYCSKMYDALGVRLDSLIEYWYEVDCLPALDIRDAWAIRIGEFPTGGILIAEPTDIIYHFKVFNRGNVQGLVKADDGQVWIIPPHEGREIKARTQAYFKNSLFFSLSTLLAQNLPITVDLKLECSDIARVDTATGVNKVDSSMFYQSEKLLDEIIVDNDDPGFKVLKAKGFDLLFLFGRGKRGSKYYNRVKPVDSWVPIIDQHCYGFPVRSAFYKRAGNGQQKVEWSTQLPQAGKYEVFFYHVKPYSVNYDPVQEFYYTVFDGREEHEVIIPVQGKEVGWVSLGVFEFTGESAKVTLRDKDRGNIGGENSRPQELVADAVKWVRL